jgi:hypothetical protein
MATMTHAAEYTTWEWLFWRLRVMRWRVRLVFSGWRGAR